MAHQRSPNCPKITFAAAADKARLIYEKENTHPAAKEVVVESLGYSGINGASLSIIGALRQYGILEGSGEALRITEDAVAYFELEDGFERQEAIARMLFHPPFFAQIRGEFGDSLPSESNLKHYLIKQGFLPRAAEEAIEVYRDNIRLVKNTPKRYNERDERGDQMTVGIIPTPQSLSLETGSVGSPIWAHSYSFALSKGTTATLQINGDVTKEGLALLKAHVDLTIRALAETTGS